MRHTEPLGEVRGIPLLPQWKNPTPYEGLPDRRIVLAKTEHANSPFIFYLNHPVQSDDWQFFVELLERKSNEELLSVDELQCLSFVFKDRLQSNEIRINVQKHILSLKEGFLAWVVNPQPDKLYTYSFIYPVLQPSKNVLEEIGFEGRLEHQKLWTQALKMLARTEWNS